VGLTGGIGSGKSEVSRRLAERGAVVIDADVLAREAVAAGTDGLSAVVAAFGTEVLSTDGGLDRAALGRRVFDDAEARRCLEAIIHPRVRARAAEIEASAAEDAVVVHDIPLLVESGRTGDFDVVVVVDAPQQVQLSRLVEGRGMTRDEALSRIGAQASRTDRREAADIVIDNSGSLADLDAQVEQLWQTLLTRRD